MNSPAAVIESATDVMRRIQRVAPLAGPEARLRMLQELAYVATVVDRIEGRIRDAANEALKVVSVNQKRRRLSRADK